MKQDDTATPATPDADSYRQWARLLILVLALGVGRPAWAQDAPSLDTIRRTQVSATDRQVIQTWLAEQLPALFQAQDGLNAGSQLLFAMPDGIVAHYRAPDSTPAFREFLADTYATTLLQAYQNNRDQAQPPAVAFAMTALKAFGRPTGLPVFQAALQDPVPAVRVLAAQGLLTLRDQTEGEQWAQLVNELQAAAATENDPYVLRQFARYLQVETPARLPQAVAAVQALLDARLQRFEQGTAVPVDADADLVRWLARQFQGLNNPDLQNRFVNQTARLLAHSLYTSMLLNPPPHGLVLGQAAPGETVARTLPQFFGLEPGPTTLSLDAGDDRQSAERKLVAFYERFHTRFPATRDRIRGMDRIVHDTEAALREMVRVRVPNAQFPQVATELLRGRRDIANNVVAELYKWIGNETAEGLLNGDPFNLPRRLGINRTLPGDQAGG